jgi:hypothetical protein
MIRLLYEHSMMRLFTANPQIIQNGWKIGAHGAR